MSKQREQAASLHQQAAKLRFATGECAAPQHCLMHLMIVACMHAISSSSPFLLVLGGVRSGKLKQVARHASRDATLACKMSEGAHRVIESRLQCDLARTDRSARRLCTVSCKDGVASTLLPRVARHVRVRAPVLLGMAPRTAPQRVRARAGPSAASLRALPPSRRHAAVVARLRATAAAAGARRGAMRRRAGAGLRRRAPSRLPAPRTRLRTAARPRPSGRACTRAAQVRRSHDCCVRGTVHARRPSSAHNPGPVNASYTAHDMHRLGTR